MTIPPNIAPLNYRYAMKDVRKAKTTFPVNGRSVTIRGAEVTWPVRKWKAFLADAAGKTIRVEASAQVGGKPVTDAWSIQVSEDPIDGYLTYRLIEPSYQMWNEVSIEERCIETFDEITICDHQHTENACMNCHVHGQQRGDYSLYYIRGPRGGAVLNKDGNLRKLTLNAPGMLSGTVYGELHPSGRFGVFSTNVIIPGFHTMAGNRMEVYDTASDLTVADFDNNVMVNVPHVARADAWETFPCFSADGSSVYYCVADTLSLPQQIAEVRYSLVRAPFDGTSGRIGEQVDTVWNGPAHQASACHPKASPDGRWLLFTYHSWSSNGRWFVFASKRGDGMYGKPYFSHLDESGRATKPFVLPQKSPRFYDNTFKSFNVPDLGRASTGMTVRDARRMFKSPSESFAQADMDK